MPNSQDYHDSYTSKAVES